MLLGTEEVSNDCLSSNDTLGEGNSKPQLSHFTIEGITNYYEECRLNSFKFRY
jgi:hypothetical protein